MENMPSYLLPLTIQTKIALDENASKPKQNEEPILSESRIEQIKQLVQNEVRNSKFRFGQIVGPSKSSQAEKIVDFREEIFCTNSQIKKMEKKMKLKDERINKFESSFRDQRKLKTFIDSRDMFKKVFLLGLASENERETKEEKEEEKKTNQELLKNEIKREKKEEKNKRSKREMKKKELLERVRAKCFGKFKENNATGAIQHISNKKFLLKGNVNLEFNSDLMPLFEQNLVEKERREAIEKNANGTSSIQEIKNPESFFEIKEERLLEKIRKKLSFVEKRAKSQPDRKQEKYLANLKEVQREYKKKRALFLEEAKVVKAMVKNAAEEAYLKREKVIQEEYERRQAICTKYFSKGKPEENSVQGETNVSFTSTKNLGFYQTNSAKRKREKEQDIVEMLERRKTAMIIPENPVLKALSPTSMRHSLGESSPDGVSPVSLRNKRKGGVTLEIFSGKQSLAQAETPKANKQQPITFLKPPTTEEAQTRNDQVFVTAQSFEGNLERIKRAKVPKKFTFIPTTPQFVSREPPRIQIKSSDKNEAEKTSYSIKLESADNPWMSPVSSTRNHKGISSRFDVSPPVEKQSGFLAPLPMNKQTEKGLAKRESSKLSKPSFKSTLPLILEGGNITSLRVMEKSRDLKSFNASFLSKITSHSVDSEAKKNNQTENQNHLETLNDLVEELEEQAEEFKNDQLSLFLLEGHIEIDQEVIVPKSDLEYEYLKIDAEKEKQKKSELYNLKLGRDKMAVLSAANTVQVVRRQNKEFI